GWRRWQGRDGGDRRGCMSSCPQDPVIMLWNNRSKFRPLDRSISGSDFLQLDVGDAPGGGMSGWLAGQLRLAISDGRLPVGSRLPATRVLAGELGVSRGVVTEAYR